MGLLLNVTLNKMEQGEKERISIFNLWRDGIIGSNTLGYICLAYIYVVYEVCSFFNSLHAVRRCWE